jgi:hypothetical protein
MNALVGEELKKAELAVCKAPTKVRGMLKSERAYEGVVPNGHPRVALLGSQRRMPHKRALRGCTALAA